MAPFYTFSNITTQDLNQVQCKYFNELTNNIPFLIQSEEQKFVSLLQSPHENYVQSLESQSKVNLLEEDISTLRDTMSLILFRNSIDFQPACQNQDVYLFQNWIFSQQNQNSRLIVLSLPLKIDLFHTFYSPRNSCRLEYYSPILK